MKRIVFPLLFLSAVLCLLFCATNKSPLPSVAHPDGWREKVSEDFHGTKVLEAGYTSCKNCHGNDLAGGESEVSCFQCHITYPHVSGWTLIGASEFHGNYIRGKNWSMASCQKCHGDDYRGGRSKSSCFDCHPNSGGPEACNTCHGSQANAAPPEDLSDNVSTSIIAVGAHQLHVTFLGGCSTCHAVPASVSQTGHIDESANAEVLSELQWNRTSRTCVTECHSDAQKSYIWNSF
ncbi:hypothetical protein JXJ21_13590 [candidate division KSB1 bacterium]|nr:hypothetical protein [candidate division KSB1 bacterium]